MTHEEWFNRKLDKFKEDIEFLEEKHRLEVEEANTCPFYPKPDSEHGGVCLAGSEVSDIVCTYDYAGTCEHYKNYRIKSGG